MQTTPATKTSLFNVHRGCSAAVEKARRFRFEGVGLKSDSPVYVKEHLCPELKKLFGKATAKKEARWNFLWVRNGQIFARKTDWSPAVFIATEDDL